MLKYYFGYKYTVGIPFPVRWVEDNGIPVGGKIDFVVGNRHEITFHEFTYTALFALKESYPFRKETTE